MLGPPPLKAHLLRNTVWVQTLGVGSPQTLLPSGPALLLPDGSFISKWPVQGAVVTAYGLDLLASLSTCHPGCHLLGALPGPCLQVAPSSAIDTTGPWPVAAGCGGSFIPSICWVFTVALRPQAGLTSPDLSVLKCNKRAGQTKPRAAQGPSPPV